MALPTDKLTLGQVILPKFDFSVTANGITIKSDRLYAPRFLPFDNAGRCKECKSDAAEIDFIVTKEGCHIYCSRIRATNFVPFDIVYALPDHCIFKVKNRGRVFNIPHEGGGEVGSVQPHQQQQENASQEQEMQAFFDSLAAVTKCTEALEQVPPSKRAKLAEIQNFQNVFDEQPTATAHVEAGDPVELDGGSFHSMTVAVGSQEMAEKENTEFEGLFSQQI